MQPKSVKFGAADLTRQDLMDAVTAFHAQRNPLADAMATGMGLAQGLEKGITGAVGNLANSGAFGGVGDKLGDKLGNFVDDALKDFKKQFKGKKPGDALKLFYPPASAYAVLAGGVTAIALPPLALKYLSNKLKLHDQKKMKADLNSKKLIETQEMLMKTFKKTDGLVKKGIYATLGVSGIALVSVGVNRLGQGASARMAEGAARKTAKTKAKAEIDVAVKKADAEIRAEKEKVAARVQEVTQSRAQRIKGNIETLEVDRSYSFDEIKGQKEAVDRLKAEALRAVHAKQLEALQGNMKVKPRSHILLIGPPGTGKTLGFQCFTSHCNENGVPMRSYVVNVGKIDPKDVALTTEEMQKVAAKNSKEGFKTGYLLDELDTNFPFLEEMKTYMEGPQALNKDVLIIGSTNHPEKLTGPVLNRFGDPIQYISADAAVRKQILETKFKEYHLEVPNEKLLRQFAEITDGYSGRDFRSVCANLRLDAETKLLQNPSKMPPPGTPLKCSPEEIMAAIQKLKFKVTLTNADAYSQEAMLKKANLNSEQLPAYKAIDHKNTILTAPPPAYDAPPAYVA